jgi:hypothetical protein
MKNPIEFLETRQRFERQRNDSDVSSVGTQTEFHQAEQQGARIRMQINPE